MPSIADFGLEVDDVFLSIQAVAVLIERHCAGREPAGPDSSAIGDERGIPQLNGLGENFRHFGEEQRFVGARRSGRSSSQPMGFCLSEKKGTGTSRMFQSKPPSKDIVDADESPADGNEVLADQRRFMPGAEPACKRGSSWQDQQRALIGLHRIGQHFVGEFRLMRLTRSNVPTL